MDVNSAIIKLKHSGYRVEKIRSFDGGKDNYKIFQFQKGRFVFQGRQTKNQIIELATGFQTKR